MRITFISWGQSGYNGRNELLAKSLNAALHYVYFDKQGNFYPAPVRYIVQARRTWQILHEERPDVIFVHNPPIFAVITSFMFAQRSGARFVIDSHTGAFISPKWRWSLMLHRMLSHKALATLVHNNHQEEIVKRWGCRYFLLSSFGREYPKGEPYSLSGKFNVAVIGSIVKEECLDIVFGAANRLPEVSFYVTGHADRVPHELLRKKPDNCHLTDFLTYDQYIGLLRGVNAVIVTTTRANTLCMGASEAVALGTPLILSDMPVSRDYFSKGTVHIANTIEGVYSGVCQVQLELPKLKQDMLFLRSQLLTEWEQQFSNLLKFIQDSNSPKSA